MRNVTKGSETFFSISLLIGPRGFKQVLSGTFIFLQKSRQALQGSLRALAQ